MFGRARIFLTTAACAAALPATAQAPAPLTTAFDGTYLGVSRTLEEEWERGRTWARWCNNLPGVPVPLTIVNGIARGGNIVGEGSVNQQGVLVMRSSSGGRFEGQIDPQGAVRGRRTGNCSYQFVWQKAAAPTMPFDGNYILVSREASRTTTVIGSDCPPNGIPTRPVIRKGVVLGEWQGTVSPQGYMTMQRSTNRLDQLEGQIDGQSIIRGTTGCVWQKE
jgi:hypothetical protein